jgi:hypothetical protein
VTRTALLLAASTAFAATAAPAHAQTAADRPARQIEVEFGAGLLGGAGLGAADANFRGNSPTRQPFRLFATSSDLARAPMWHARVAFVLTRRLVLEGSLTNTKPDVRVSATADVEGASPIEITETIDQYFIDGSVLVMFDELAIGPRLVPFAAAGGGYLRQLHEGQVGPGF